MTEGQALVISGLEAVITASGKLTQRFLQLVSIIPGEGELGTILQDDAILAMKPGLQLLNAIDTDYRRAVDAQKLLGIELGFQTADCLAE